VTEIDRNHLFYLMARGVDEKSARGLLVKAFLAEVIEELAEPVVEARWKSGWTTGSRRMGKKKSRE
jgi:Fe-S cluster assembly scaffold protein SufB